MSEQIDVAHLIRTGEIKKIPKATFSDYIIAAAEYFQENDHSIGKSYWLTLRVIRPDIAEKIVGTDCNAYQDNDLLPAMLREVYRLW